MGTTVLFKIRDRIQIEQKGEKLNGQSHEQNKWTKYQKNEPYTKDSAHFLNCLLLKNAKRKV